jgi:hypothetical protein
MARRITTACETGNCKKMCRDPSHPKQKRWKCQNPSTILHVLDNLNLDAVIPFGLLVHDCYLVLVSRNWFLG